MTGEKNRFKTTEKLWDLDDKQLKSPQHDAMVLWLMDEDNLINTIKYIVKSEETDIIHLPKSFSAKKGDTLHHYCNIKSEVPLQANNGFINGYADLIIRLENQKVVELEYIDVGYDEYYSRVINTKTVGQHVALINEYLEEEVYTADNYEPYFKYEHYSGCIVEFEYGDTPLFDLKFKNDKNFNTHYGEYTKPSRAKVNDFIKHAILKKYGEYPISDLGTYFRGNVKITRSNCFANIMIEVKPYIKSFGEVLRQINSYKRFYHPRLRGETYYCLFTLDDKFDNQFQSQNIHVLHPPADVSIDDMRKMYGL